MPKPKPIWERWRDDPNTSEKYYLFMFIGFILVNFIIFAGIVLFFVFLYYR